MEGPRPGVVARYGDGNAAGRAIERLSMHGIDGGRIRTARDLDPPLDRHAQRSTDAGTAGRLGRRFLRGAAYGVVPGALLGLLAMLLATDHPTSLAIGALAGALAGAGLGALTGLQSTPTMSTAWAETFRPDQPGGAAVVVTCPDDPAMDEVERLLSGTGAIEVRRTGDTDAVEPGGGSHPSS